MNGLEGSGRLRRAGAFAIDALGFALIAWVACRTIDHRVSDAFPPHQAAKASARMVPVLLVLFTAWFIVPVALWQASLGKKVFRLKIVRAVDGKALGWPQLVIRELMLKWLSLAMNGAGFIDGLLTGVAFHDRLIDSRVVSDEDDLDFEAPWSEVSWAAIGLTAAVSVFIAWSFRTNGLVAHVLRNGALYIPHEAGHLVVGLVMPHLVGVMAGAWGQLLFPSIAAIAFARRRSTVQLAGTLVWLAFSLFDIAQYAADAWYREGALPVAVGDDFSEDHLDAHDWWQLLSAAKLLRYAQPVGDAIETVGWVAVVAAFGLMVRQAVTKPSE